MTTGINKQVQTNLTAVCTNIKANQREMSIKVSIVHIELYIDYQTLDKTL